MNSPMPPGFAAFLGGPSNASTYDRRGLPEAQVARLRELLDIYERPNPYRRGDLLQPRPGLNVSAPGPFIVVEVLPAPTMPSFGSGACCSDDRFDIRVACVMPKGELGLAWASSVRVEPWAGAADIAVPDTGEG